MKQEITYISVDRLHPHPDNPRKDLGDLTELTESIKINGILQNLTVVPHPTEVKEYRVVIGHRRLAAAKLAGLTVLPCIAVYMTPKEQLATMMTENLQRSDLTIMEQAKGFQLMLDFGDDIKSLAKKTGFSQSTIRRRVNLLSLDQERLAKALVKSISLDDYAKVCEIKDERLRNKALDAIGTDYFNSAILYGKRVDAFNEWAAKVVYFLDSFAERRAQIKHSDRSSWRWVQTFTTGDHVLVPEDANACKYAYIVVESGCTIQLYRERVEEDNPSAPPSILDIVKPLVEEVLRLNEWATLMREDRIRDLTASEAKAAKHQALIKDYVARALVGQLTGSLSLNSRWSLNGSPSELLPKLPESAVYSEDELCDLREAFFERYEKAPTATTALLLYLLTRAMGDHECRTVSTFMYANEEYHYGKFEVHRALTAEYALLESLGYPPSDEEKQMLDGSHPLYAEIESLWAEHLDKQKED
ncbi:MAG: ParB/RepB/Spo0J family partition protein [Clostridia bacterium]|nr:ParB/RepB/Spo0J family partition protein [Clostridia bacterium]